MLMIGPIINVVLALLSLPFIPLVKRASHGASVGLYVLAGVAFPLVAIIVDGVFIGSMNLHGC